MTHNVAVAVCDDKPRGLMASAVEPGEIIGIINHVHTIIAKAFKEDIRGDYAAIPGTGDKPALLKPGAEKLLLAFGLVAHSRPPVMREIGDGHREVIVETEIRSLSSGRLHAVGLGSCSTMESKYRWRGAAGRECPSCHAVACVPSKKEYGGGYYCNPKSGGCGAKYKGNSAEAKTLDTTAAVRQPNPDIADTYNTVLKMAKKRSMVDGAIAATASSAMFTQDVEERVADDAPAEREKRQEEPPPADNRSDEQRHLDALKKKLWAFAKSVGVSHEQLKNYSVSTLGKASSNEWNADDCDALLLYCEDIAAAKQKQEVA